eukprot:657459-Hanusia_phi.AAC.1
MREYLTIPVYTAPSTRECGDAAMAGAAAAAGRSRGGEGEGPSEPDMTGGSSSTVSDRDDD